MTGTRARQARKDACLRILAEEMDREAEWFAFGVDPDDADMDARIAESKARVIQRTNRRCFWWGFTHPFVGREWLAAFGLAWCIGCIVWAIVR